MDIRAYLKHGHNGPYLRIRIRTNSFVEFRNIPVSSSIGREDMQNLALAYALNRYPEERVVMQLPLPIS
ncbi:hypothetical protein [Desulfovibrio inopinatus]|uniref:hypothetical protein n=1 Tax=Desulfovibrio inopinatus TaxID=102109 RepID=UPI00041B426E|nr:hypothetical protein [Desulfovibrio inopinatus]